MTDTEFESAKRAFISFAELHPKEAAALLCTPFAFLPKDDKTTASKRKRVTDGQHLAMVNAFEGTILSTVLKQVPLRTGPLLNGDCVQIVNSHDQSSDYALGIARVGDLPDEFRKGLKQWFSNQPSTPIARFDMEDPDVAVEILVDTKGELVDEVDDKTDKDDEDEEGSGDSEDAEETHERMLEEVRDLFNSGDDVLSSLFRKLGPSMSAFITTPRLVINVNAEMF